eukprot:PhM_4_TR14640/c0_g1_i1/m.34006
MDIHEANAKTWDCLRRVSGSTDNSNNNPNCSYELIEPHLLYLTDEQSQHYAEIQTAASSTYKDGFHRDTIELIEANVGVVPPLPSTSMLIVDLGPGYPDKTLPIVEHAHHNGVVTTYCAVDISAEFSTSACSVVAPFVAATHPVCATFEDFARDMDKYLSTVVESRFDAAIVFLGLTIMNFPAETSHAWLHMVLSKLLARAGAVHIVVASEVLTAANTPDDVVKAYSATSHAMDSFVFGPLRNIGVARGDADAVCRFNSDARRVEYGFKFNTNVTLTKPNGDAFRFHANDWVVVAVSYRRTVDEFRQVVRSLLNETFNTTDGCEPGKTGSNESATVVVMHESGKTVIGMCTAYSTQR